MMKLRGGFQQQQAAGEEPASAGAAFRFISRRGAGGSSLCASGRDRVRHRGGRRLLGRGAVPGRAGQGWAEQGWPGTRQRGRAPAFRRPSRRPCLAPPVRTAPACGRGRGGPRARCGCRRKRPGKAGVRGGERRRMPAPPVRTGPRGWQKPSQPVGEHGTICWGGAPQRHRLSRGERRGGSNGAALCSLTCLLQPRCPWSCRLGGSQNPHPN